MATIFRAAVQFHGSARLGVALCIVFPQIVIWLPRLLYATSG